MGRITEFFDYINQDKEITAEYDLHNYTSLVITKELRAFRKKRMVNKRDRNNKK